MATFMICAGLGLLIGAMSPPVDALTERFLSAHMMQHMLVATIAPLLLVAGIAGITGNGRFKRVCAWTCPAVLGWLSGVGATLLWHVPLLFNFAALNARVHGLEHASLLAAGCLFWWPVFGPEERRLPVITAGFYLVTACIACTATGIVIALGPAGIYPAYPDATDQQIAGLMMWIPGCLIYLGSIMGVLARYYQDPPVVKAANE